MITLDLIEFIEKEQKSGLSRDEIKSQLLSAGWLDEDIEEGFLKVTPAYTPKPIAPPDPVVQAPVSGISYKPAEPTVLPQASSPESDVDLNLDSAPNDLPVFVEEKKPEVIQNSVAQPKVSTPVLEDVKPKIDPYREPVKEEKKVDIGFSSYNPPSNLPKIWTPSNIPVVSNDHTEVIPNLIPKKIEVSVPSKSVLPPVNTPERKNELAKVYQAPPVVAPAAPVVNPPIVVPIASVSPNAAPSAGINIPSVENTPNPVPVAAPVYVPPVVGQSMSYVPPTSPAPAPTSPAQKPPYMVFAKQELSKPMPGPSSYSPNAAVTSSYPRDVAGSFVPAERKPGVPKFLIFIFVFVVFLCVLGGLAFAHITGIINIPFAPKVGNLINSYSNNSSMEIDSTVQIQPESVDTSLSISYEDVSGEVLPVDYTAPSIIPSPGELKQKDSQIESLMSDLELQIYKKYALNKNQYGLKPNAMGSCSSPEKDSLFYSEAKDSVSVLSGLDTILTITDGVGACYSTTRAWAMSFPLLSESGSFVCIDSMNKKITTKNTLTGVVCK